MRPARQRNWCSTVADELREKMVVGVNVSGQVREFQLRLRVRLSVRTAKGKADHRGR